MRSPWLAIVALGLLLVGVALALRASRGERATVRRADEGALAAPLDGELVDPTRLADASRAGREPAEASRAAAPSTGSPKSPSSARAKPEEELVPREIELVEVGSGRPLGGAEAWVHEGWVTSAFWAPLGRGQRVPVDALGVARFLWPRGSQAVLEARSGALAGRGVVPLYDEAGARGRIELHPDWDVEVEVLWADGSPAAGIPVRFGFWRDLGGRSEETDERGHARLAHAGLGFEENRASELEVSLDVPLTEPVFRRLARAPVPDETVRLVLPPGCPLEVLLLDLTGEPLTDAATVSLLRKGSTAAFSRMTLLRQGSAPAFSKRTLRGRVTFPFVAVGVPLDLRVSLAHPAFSVQERLPGPAFGQVRLEHRVVLGSATPVLDLRVLGAGSAPLGSTALEFESLAGSGSLEPFSASVVTDAEGRCLLEVPSAPEPEDRALLLVSTKDGARSGLLPVTGPLLIGRNALGDLELAPTPLLVAGRVLDGDGKPVGRARVTVEERIDFPDVPESSWSWQRVRSPTSDAAGRFELHHPHAARGVRLQASLGNERSASVEVQPGTEDLELVLRALGRLVGRVWLDPDVPASSLTLRARAWSGAGVQESRLERDGSFLVQGLDPGLLTLEVWCADTLVVTVEDLRVEPGAECRDPRLDPLDLRGRLHVLRLTLVTPGSDPSLSGGLRFGDALAPERSWLEVRGPSLELVTPVLPLEGRLAVRGYRTLLLHGLDRDREVVLEPTPEVTLVLPSEVELPPAPARLHACLLAPDEERLSGDWVNAFDEERELTCFAPRTGRLRVGWFLHPPGGAPGRFLRIEPEQEVEVRDVPGQRFLLRVDAEALRLAMEPALQAAPR